MVSNNVKCRHTECRHHREGRRASLRQAVPKQYLPVPASSAGVERVFSAAGKMHADLRKSMTDETLKHSLFAA